MDWISCVNEDGKSGNAKRHFNSQTITRPQHRPPAVFLFQSWIFPTVCQLYCYGILEPGQDQSSISGMITIYSVLNNERLFRLNNELLNYESSLLNNEIFSLLNNESSASYLSHLSPAQSV